MTKLAALLGLMVAAAPVVVAQEVPPPVTVSVDDDAAELDLRLPFYKSFNLALDATLRGGVFAPAGILKTPYATVKDSPYGAAGLGLRYSGHVESMVRLSLGYLKLHSQKGVPDPDGKAASPATSLEDHQEFAQTWLAGSAYADIGKVVPLGGYLNAAFFAAADAFAFSPSEALGDPVDAMVEANAGSVLMYERGPHEASLFGDVQLEGAMKNMYSNYGYTVVPSLSGGAEYAYHFDGNKASAGVEVESRRADLGVRPYAGLSNDWISAVVAGDFRESRDDFYPDSKGVGADILFRPVDGMEVGVRADYSHKLYPMAPAPSDSLNVMGVFSMDLGGAVRARAGKKIQARGPAEFVPEWSEDMNGRLPEVSQIVSFDRVLRASDDFDSFVKGMAIKDLDGILATVSSFSGFLSDRNYNDDEDKTPNVQGIDQIYARARASYISGEDDPILVCIGAAQITSVLAEELGRQAGIPIQGSAVTVGVTDEDGRHSGHAAAAIKTEDYGIVFADWGKLTPTYTFDTEESLRIYQALQGMPVIHHQITRGRNGEHVGYLFSEEGKLFVKRLTFHANAPSSILPRLFDDGPRGRDITVERFKNLSRKRR